MGDVIDGVTCAGIAEFAPSLAGGWIADCESVEFSIAGICGAMPVSSSVIAILNVPSTITTTLAPTRSERIFDVIFDGCFGWPEVILSWPRPALSGGGAAAAAFAARRAAAMKLEVLTGSCGVGGISLIASSDAAIRSDGEAVRPDGRVPGSSG